MLPTDEERHVTQNDVPDLGLTDEAANARLAEAVSSVAASIRAGECNRQEALVRLSDLVYPIAGDDPDALDTTVRTNVVRELNPVLEQAGFPAMVPWEF